MCDGEVVRPEHIRLRKRSSQAMSGDAILANGNGQTAPIGNGALPDVPRTPPVEGAQWQDSSPLLHVPPGGITLEAMERLLILETLRRAHGNRSLAARMLGVSRPTVIRKIEQYQLT
jgi:transcriptional regulator with PAS, ATPase and Fis domain